MANAARLDFQQAIIVDDTKCGGSIGNLPIVVSDAITLLQIQELRRLAWASTGEVPNFISGNDILTNEHDVHGLHWA
jgi:hypothetical protein